MLFLKSLLQAPSKLPATMGVTSLSQLQIFLLHLCRSPHGPLPWLELTTILLVLIRDIALPVIANTSFLNLGFFWALIQYDGRNIYRHGKQLSQHVYTVSCHPLPLPSPIRNGGIYLLVIWNSKIQPRLVRRLESRPFVYLGQQLMT